MELKGYKLNIIKIYIIMFLNSLIFAYVIERIFALERGLTILEMQYIGIVFSVISFFLEVPCGVLADKWKKKYVWALGIGFCFFEFFISIFAYNFQTFILAFVAAAIGCSLKSGTWDSILYESLIKLGREGEYEKFRGYLKLLKYTSNGTVGIFGGYIAYRYGLVTNYWLSLIGTPIAIVLCLSIYEPIRKRKSITKMKIFHHLTESLRVIKNNRSLMHIIFYGGIIGSVLYGQLHEMSSLIYPKIGIPIYLFGYIGFAITLLGGLSGVLASKVKDRFSYTFIFGVILIISTVSIFMFSNAKYAFDVVYLVIAIFLMEMVFPLTSGYIHKSITDEYRATISSVESFALNGLTAIVGLIFGYFADKYSIFEGFTSLVVLLSVYSIYYFISLNSHKKSLKNIISPLTR